MLTTGRNQNQNKMHSENTIQTAISRSVERDEIVRVEVDNLDEAYTEVSANCDDCDCARDDGSLDVWGTEEGEGSDFRLRLVLSKKRQ